MFKHEISTFGPYKKHSLCNDTGTNLTLLPEYGACLLDLSFGGTSILDACQTPEELTINRWFKNLVLYPFPNRIKHGIYQWRDSIYQFPINDQSTGNALHGFGYNQGMLVEKVNLKAEKATIRLKYIYQGHTPAYMFPFIFHIQFDLTADQLEVNMSFQNTGTGALPIGWGWHPYFQLSDQVDSLEIQTSKLHLVGIDTKMIPTGKRYPYEEFLQTKKLGVAVLDNCFAVEPDADKINVRVKGEKGTLNYWQECGAGKYNFIQLFTPPHRKSLAIEPMTCNIDAFNNKEGLIELKAGEIAQAKFGLHYTY